MKAIVHILSPQYRLVIPIVLFFSILLFACSADEGIAPKQQESDLELIATYNLIVPEPSGLSLNYNTSYLWVVSDQTGKVYKVSLDGRTLQTLAYTGEDLEAVTQNPVDKTLWVAEERSREIVQLDTLGNELARFHIPVEQIDANNGLEGIAFNTSNDHLYVLNEKAPHLLVELNTNQAILNQYALTFADDCSGLVYDPTENIFWIISDESQTITKCDVTGNPIESFNLTVPKLEGIALDLTRKVAYLVSDSKEELYIFSLN